MQVFSYFFLLILLFFLKPLSFTAQSIHYSDFFKGGVCVVGTSTADNNGTCSIPFFIETSSTIKKIFFITYTELSANTIFLPLPKDIQVNGYDLTLELNVNNGSYLGGNLINSNTLYGHQTNVYDLTNQISMVTSNNITLNWNSNDAPDGCPSCRFASAMFVILYENPNLDKVAYSMIINESSNANSQNFNFIPQIPFDFTKDISLGFHTDRLGAGTLDGYNFFINSSSIGQIFSPENFYGFGVTGNFYYQNGQLTGLDNDIADDVISGGDAILNINNYLSGDNPINIEYNYIQPTALVHNFFVSMHLAHSTPCQPFPVTVSPDTIICRNSPPLQLSASGGTQYLWQPATDLSCTTCPNPVFTGDSSRFYTVRIWNNDSCSVVRPVKVNVKPLPSFSSMQVSPSSCGGNTGYIVSNSTLLGESYSINGGALQQTGSFPSLSSGTYTVTLHELNGCTRDSVVTVGTNITVDALFTATPHSGGAPLTVYFNNQSTNATAYEWFLNNQTQGNSFSNFTFDTTGIYTVTLVAWQNDPSCADTFSIQIHVYDSLIVQVPNVFTPNNDGKNDIFGIQANIPVSIDYQILNRWGNVMISGKEVVSAAATSGNQFTILWDGSGATEGTYFYKIEVTALSNGKKEVLDGFMELIR